MSHGSGEREPSSAGETLISLPSDTEIVAVRRFRAPRDRVFAAFITPRLIERWWGPAGWRTFVDSMEARAGGQFRIRLLGPSGEVHLWAGTILELIPEVRLVRTLEFDKFPGLRLVETALFEDTDDGTRVTLRTDFPSPPDPERMTAASIQNGVRSTLDRLDQLLRKPTTDGR